MFVCVVICAFGLLVYICLFILYVDVRVRVCVCICICNLMVACAVGWLRGRTCDCVTAPLFTCVAVHGVGLLCGSLGECVRACARVCGSFGCGLAGCASMGLRVRARLHPHGRVMAFCLQCVAVFRLRIRIHF